MQGPSIVHYDSLGAFPSISTSSKIVKSRLLQNVLIQCLEKILSEDLHHACLSVHAHNSKTLHQIWFGPLQRLSGFGP